MRWTRLALILIGTWMACAMASIVLDALKASSLL